MKRASIDEMVNLKKRLYNRVFNTDVFSTEDGSIISISTMKDDFHNIELSIVIEPKNFIIKDIEAKAYRAPYKMCDNALNEVKNLIGLSIFKSGILKEYRTIVKREESCTHVSELFEISINTLFAHTAVVRHSNHRDLFTKDEIMQMGVKSSVLSNSCKSFNQKNEDDKIFSSIKEKIIANNLNKKDFLGFDV